MSVTDVMLKYFLECGKIFVAICKVSACITHMDDTRGALWLVTLSLREKHFA